METIIIDEEWTMIMPSNFQRIKLPFFNEWITALESGKYEQGRGKLKTEDNKYCCLGVLMEIQGQLISSKQEDLASDNPCFSILGSLGFLPYSIFLSRECYVDHLAAANDKEMSFLSIAKVIKLIWCPEKKEL